MYSRAVRGAICSISINIKDGETADCFYTCFSSILSLLRTEKDGANIGRIS